MTTNRDALFSLPTDLLARFITICPNDVDEDGIENYTHINCTFKQTQDCHGCIMRWLEGKITIFEAEGE